MRLENTLLRVCDAYCEARKIVRATASTLALNDGRTLDRVAKGGSITIRNYERAMRWFSANWPDAAEWPADIERPDPVVTDEAAAAE